MVAYVPTGGAPATKSPEDALSLFRQMERDFTNSQPYVSPTPTEPQGISYPNPADLAASEFGPQFAALDAAAKEQASRYKVSTADLARMYEALAQSTLARTGDVRAGYADTGKNLQNTYENATNTVATDHSNSLNQIAELLNRLGIQQAAPDVLKQSESDFTKALSQLAQRSAGAQTLNTRLGQNQVDYLGKTADTNRLAGTNAQADLLKQFQALQAQNDAKRLDLTSQQQAAANSYGLNISKMQQDSAQNELAAQLKQAQLELDKAKLSHTTENDNALLQLRQQDQLNSIKDPNAKLSSNAYDMYNGDASAAANATMNIINAYQKSGGTSLNDLLGAIDTLPTADPLDRDRYKQLALSFWVSLNGN